jgi:hypothetical protein
MLKRSLIVITALATIAILVFTIWVFFQPQKTNDLSLIVTPRYENEQSMIGLMVKPTKKTPPDVPTNPPATNPPATDPPATNPPATNPPVTEPPISNSPVIVPNEDGDSDAFNTREAQKLTLTAEAANILTPTASETIDPIATTPASVAPTASLSPGSTPGEESSSGIKNIFAFIVLVVVCVGIVILAVYVTAKVFS